MASTDSDSAVEHKRSTVRPDKGEAVAELTRSFTESAAAVLTEYRGLSVKQITALRVALGADSTYAVVKNTLTKIAARDAGLEGLDALLSGPTAVAFVNGDPVTAAKSLRDYARTNPALIVKGGVMDGKAMTADEVRKLADLESREVLLAKMAGALQGSLTQAVRLFAAPLAQAARAVGALEAKATADPSVLRGGAGTPAAASDDAQSAQAPVAEAVAAEAPVDEAPGAEAAAADASATPADAPDASATPADAPDAAVDAAAAPADDESAVAELADETLASTDASSETIPETTETTTPSETE